MSEEGVSVISHAEGIHTPPRAINLRDTVSISQIESKDFVNEEAVVKKRIQKNITKLAETMGSDTEPLILSKRSYQKGFENTTIEAADAQNDKSKESIHLKTNQQVYVDQVVKPKTSISPSPQKLSQNKGGLVTSISAKKK